MLKLTNLVDNRVSFFSTSNNKMTFRTVECFKLSQTWQDVFVNIWAKSWASNVVPCQNWRTTVVCSDWCQGGALWLWYSPTTSQLVTPLCGWPSCSLVSYKALSFIVYEINNTVRFNNLGKYWTIPEGLCLFFKLNNLVHVLIFYSNS